VEPSRKTGATDNSKTHLLEVIALPEAQEFSAAPCDTGLPIQDLVAEFDAPGSRWEGRLDLSLLPPEWGSEKVGKWAPDEEAVERRARDARRLLRERMKEVSRALASGEVGGDCVVVSHGHFLHVLTEDWSDFDPIAGSYIRFIPLCNND
jgi:broad specificity phosphatase PhoE